MINNFIRALKNVKGAKTKLLRHIIIRGFAALQNAVSMTEAKEIFAYICRICLSEKESRQLHTSIKNISKMNHNVDMNMDDDLEEDKQGILSTDETLTIKMASPYTNLFQNVKDQIIYDESSSGSSNAYYCPGVINILQDKCLPVYPLWSRVVLGYIQDEEDIRTRDTNVPVENWFKFLKEDKGMKKMRPGQFVIDLKRAVEGRLLEHIFPGARKPKSNKRKLKLDNPELEEEVWKKNQNQPEHQSTTRVRQE